mgnify:CR=1 FL=1
MAYQISDDCISCGVCASNCPVSAISEGDGKYVIDADTCISCGACVYQCPFGAISDKSYITKAVRILKESDHNRRYKTYAVVAPSLGAQYADVEMGRVLGGLLKLGFYYLVEAAWGADFVAYLEAQELAEKTESEVVQVIGNRLVLFKRNPKEPVVKF